MVYPLVEGFSPSTSTRVRCWSGFVIGWSEFGIGLSESVLGLGEFGIGLSED